MPTRGTTTVMGREWRGAAAEGVTRRAGLGGRRGVGKHRAWGIRAAAAVAAVRPAPALTVALETDRLTYENVPGATALLSARASDEAGKPTTGLDAGAFVTTVDGRAVTTIFAETETPG